MRPLSVIGAPSSAGAYSPGQEKAPAAWRRHGLVESLALGRDVHDEGDVTGFRWRPDNRHPKAMNLDAVRATAQGVAAKVASAFAAGHDVIVLGGDCTVELGTVAGVLRSRAGSVGLVYVDVDTDMNPPEASDGALDWTGAAHLLAIPGANDELANIGDVRPLLRPSDILCFAAGNMATNERETIATLGIACIGLAEVQADPNGTAAQAATWASRFDTLLVHLDMDVLNFAAFPIAENTRRDMGLTLEQLNAVLSVLLAAPSLRGLTITEVNPEHAPDERETFAALISMMSGALRCD